MPIEIRELNIRIHVNQSQPEQDGAQQQQGGAGAAMPDKDELIAACVEQVMDRLKEKQER